MITLFLSPSCTSCRKARAWLEKHDDIISTRSKIFQKLNVDVEDLSISALIKLIEENPSLLRRPIILDQKRMQIGFNEDEIRAFLPRGYRKEELRSATLRAEIQ